MSFIRSLGRETSAVGFIKFGDARGNLHIKKDFKLLGDYIMHPLHYVDYTFSIHLLLICKFLAVAVKATFASNKRTSSH